jgi:hypothetical protein
VGRERAMLEAEGIFPAELINRLIQSAA